jgi:hypothetical protein
MRNECRNYETTGKKTHMTAERLAKLQEVGFLFSANKWKKYRANDEPVDSDHDDDHDGEEEPQKNQVGNPWTNSNGVDASRLYSPWAPGHNI